MQTRLRAVKRHVTLSLVLLTVAAGGTRLDAQLPTDTFADAQTRELVRLARVRRSKVETHITRYQALARERTSVRVQAGGVAKTLLQRAVATRIDWRHAAPTRLEVLGARTDAPLISSLPQVSLSRLMQYNGLAFDPRDPDALLMFDSTVVIHPLATGSESHYRFAAGDSMAIRLTDGRRIMLRELRIIPRRSEPQLINGSFWLDSESHVLVRAVFKLARNYDAEVDAMDLPALAQFIGITSDDGMPNGKVTLPGILKPIRADLEFIAVDYGLWDSRWWLPRRVVWRGVLQAGRYTVPASYERTYEEYVVEGDTTGTPAVESDFLFGPCRASVRFTGIGTDTAQVAARQAMADTARVRARRHEEMLNERRREWGGERSALPDCPHALVIAAASDSVLLSSSDLPLADAFDLALITDSEVEDITALIAATPDLSPNAAVRLQWGPTGPGLLRYNRIEGLSAGVRLWMDPAPDVRLTSEARMGVADRQLRGELALESRGDRFLLRPSVYRRLASTAPAAHTHGTVSSIRALVGGVDDEDYFNATGAEVVLRPAVGRSQSYDLRLFTERQTAVEVNSEFSFADLVGLRNGVRSNMSADRAQQYGATLRLRASRGFDTSGPRLGGELLLSGETGDFRIARAEALVRAELPLPRHLFVAVEGAAGQVRGSRIPEQALWRLGGAGTLRGYPGSSLVGERYWRARAEAGWGNPIMRFGVFYDRGHVGRYPTLMPESLHSAGIVISLFDGMVRLDAARRLK